MAEILNRLELEENMTRKEIIMQIWQWSDMSDVMRPPVKILFVVRSLLKIGVAILGNINQINQSRMVS